MDQKTIIKWALIAAAAYVVYKFVLKDGLLNKLLGTTATATTTTPVVAPAPVVSAPALTTEQRTMQAAAGVNKDGSVDWVRAKGIKYNSDSWNYYRGAAGLDVPNVDLFPPGNRDYQMTIDEYLQARAAKGLSGFGGLGRGFLDLSQMVAVNPWLV